MLMYHFSLRQFLLMKCSFFMHSTRSCIHPRLDPQIEPNFSNCSLLSTERTIRFCVQVTPESSTGSGSYFKASKKTGHGLKTHPTDWKKTGIELATPGLQGIGLSPKPQRFIFTVQANSLMQSHKGVLNAIKF